MLGIFFFLSLIAEVVVLNSTKVLFIFNYSGLSSGFLRFLTYSLERTGVVLNKL